MIRQDSDSSQEFPIWLVERDREPEIRDGDQDAPLCGELGHIAGWRLTKVLHRR